MTDSLEINASNPVAGLGTFQATIVNPGEYTVEVESTLPSGSGLQIVVNQNASPVLTIGGVSTNPTPTQKSLGSSVRLQCVAADVVSVELSSSNSVDSLPNSVKSIVNLYQRI